jgi:uncharacterized membrane protein YhaH (DUF805 family)
MGETPREDGPDRSEETAKLELPKLSLRRRRKQQRDVAPTAEPTAEDTRALTQPLAEQPVAEPKTAPEPEPQQRPVLVETQPTDGKAEPVDEPVRERRRPSLPAINPRLAAAVTGLVVGAVGTALIYLSLQGCDAVKGTESCGAAGLPIIVVILVLMVLLGGFVLAAWRFSDARATSALGVGVLCVLMMVAAMQELFSAWMFLVVPLVCAVSFLLAHWVTTAFVEQQPEKGPEHDVR